MRVMFVGLAALAVGISGAASAEAAEKCFDKGTLTYVDCPQEAPAVVATEPAPEPVYSWSGVYIGAHAGYARASIGGVFDGDNGANVTDPLDLDSLSPAGWLAGGQIGYLHQFDNNVVLGVEVDASYVDADDNISNIDDERGSAEVNFVASARVRAGYAIDRVLPYATGGVGLISYQGLVTDNGGTSPYSIDETAFAGVVGGGLEIAVTENILLRGEGLYYFVSDDNDLNGQLTDSDVGDSFDLDGFWTARAALSYKF